MIDPERHSRLVNLLETVHIPLWLIKDVCWLMTYRVLGVIVAVPTIVVAVVMAIITRKDKEKFLPNVSIAFWILANANWMFAEFFEIENIRFYSLFPFLLGILVFIAFLVQKVRRRNKIRYN
jgi:hypothetical protein